MNTLKPKQLFLIDGIGALVSAFFLGVILVMIEEYIGLSKEILYALTIPACIFSLYSFTCFLFLKNDWSKHLNYIAIANSLYALVTIALMLVHYKEMKTLGFVYFSGELIILFVLIWFEFKVSLKYARNTTL